MPSNNVRKCDRNFIVKKTVSQSIEKWGFSGFKNQEAIC